jgi:hypothetical protein
MEIQASRALGSSLRVQVRRNVSRIDTFGGDDPKALTREPLEMQFEFTCVAPPL